MRGELSFLNSMWTRRGKIRSDGSARSEVGDDIVGQRFRLSAWAIRVEALAGLISTRQFDVVTNYQANHCFVDGWLLDLAA
jgi:hypothetical protein